MKKNSIQEQLRRNAVALISLAVACTSLAYNTWRNEHSEDNRNRRWAAFETILKLNELQDLVFTNFYDCDRMLRGSPRTGWTILQTIEDLARLRNQTMPEHTIELRSSWEQNWSKIDFVSPGECELMKSDDAQFGKAQAAVFEIRDSIRVVREDALAELQSLN